MQRQSTSRTEGTDKNGAPPQQRDKQDRPELPAKIREYDNRLEQIDTYFPIVMELLPIAEQCREVGFTEELTRQIVTLQPVEFKGRLYSKETPGKVQDRPLDGNRREKSAGERKVPAVH